MTDPIDTQALLSRLQGMAREAGLAAPPSADVRPPAGIDGAPGVVGVAGARPGDGADTDFGALVGDALRSVDARSDAARELTVGYERGRPDVELSDVMIAAQKARVSFEALVQVRNKMVSAYRDIMNMPL